MTTCKRITINATGLQQIREWLIENHKAWSAEPDRLTDEVLSLYASEAEESAGTLGGCPQFELRAWDTVRGQTAVCWIGEDGQDVEIVEVEA